MDTNPVARSPRQLFTGALLVVAAVGFVLAFRAEVERIKLVRWLLDYTTAVSHGEATLFVMHVWYVVPATVLLGLGLRALLGGVPAKVSSAFGSVSHAVALAGLVTLALALNSSVRAQVTGGADFTDDERLYWYQAQVLLDGSVLGPLPPAADLFHYEFIVRSHTGEGMAGLFGVGQPLLLALGSLVGNRDLFQWLSVGVLVLLTYRLSVLMWGQPRVALLAAAMVALSPWWLFAAASRHGSVPTAVFTAGGLVCAMEWSRSRRVGWAVGAGVLVAAVFTTRSFDGTVLLGAVGAWWLWGVLRAKEWSRVGTLVLAGVVFTAGISFQLYVNWRSTGSMLKPTYALWVERDWPDAILFGFGKGTWNFEQTPGSALLKTLLMTMRLAQWFGGNLAAFGLVVAGLVVAPRTPLVKVAWLWGGTFVAGYFLFVFPSVHDFGTVYHLPLLPLLAGFAAVGAHHLVTTRRLATSAVAAVWLVGAVTFVPVQVDRLRFVAQRTLAPLELAEEAAERLGADVVVLWKTLHPTDGQKVQSWVYKAPPLSPRQDERVLWASDLPGAASRVAELFPSRKVLRLVWDAEGVPHVEPVERDRRP